MIFEHSPEQVSGVLKAEHRIKSYMDIPLCAGGQKQWTHLRQAGKRRKRYGLKDTLGQLYNRVSIEQRPDIVDEKSRIGDWEIDTVIGQNHKGALVTIVERKSKFTRVQKSKVSTQKALLPPQWAYKDKVFTLSADNGKEFAKHETIAKELEADVFFAHPYSSWERGVNENTNGLIRQYFPKGSSFEGITAQDIDTVMHLLNHRPRKTLNYQTPHDVFFDENERKAA